MASTPQTVLHYYWYDIGVGAGIGWVFEQVVEGVVEKDAEETVEDDDEQEEKEDAEEDDEDEPDDLEVIPETLEGLKEPVESKELELACWLNPLATDEIIAAVSTAPLCPIFKEDDPLVYHSLPPSTPPTL